MVMGAAEYNGMPTLDLQARLKEALILFRKGDAHLIMVTGSKEKGDLDTEAGASETYLEQTRASRRRHPRGRAATTATRTWPKPPPATPATPRPCWSPPTPSTRTAPWRSSSLGLTPSPTPTRTSPITGWSTVPYFFKEAVGVGLGRIIGFNHLEWLHDA